MAQTAGSQQDARRLGNGGLVAAPDEVLQLTDMRGHVPPPVLETFVVSLRDDRGG